MERLRDAIRANKGSITRRGETRWKSEFAIELGSLLKKNLKGIIHQ